MKRNAIALLFEKNTEKAEKILSSFDKTTKKFPYRQEVDGEKELMLEALKIYNIET